MGKEGKMSRCFIILGAPFSGVEDLALSMPHDVYLCGSAIASLHRRLFNDNGVLWHDPKEVVWSNDLKDARDDIIDEASQHDVWALADTLTPFTIRGWLKVLSDYEIIGVIRDLKPFSQELSKEHGFSKEVCKTIWRRYNDKILALEHEFGPFPSVSFSSGTFDNDVKELFHKVGLG